MGNIERTDGSDRHARGTMQGLAGRLHGAGKSVRKYLAATGRLIARERLEHHVVAALGIGRSIPRAVEGDEHAVAIVARERLFFLQGPPLWGPNGAKKGR